MGSAAGSVVAGTLVLTAGSEVVGLTELAGVSVCSLYVTSSVAVSSNGDRCSNVVVGSVVDIETQPLVTNNKISIIVKKRSKFDMFYLPCY